MLSADVSVAALSPLATRLSKGEGEAKDACGKVKASLHKSLEASAASLRVSFNTPGFAHAKTLWYKRVPP